MKEVYKKAIKICKFCIEHPKYLNINRDVIIANRKLPTLIGPAVSYRISFDGYKRNEFGFQEAGVDIVISLQRLLTGKIEIHIMAEDCRNNNIIQCFDEECENLINELFNIFEIKE